MVGLFSWVLWIRSHPGRNIGFSSFFVLLWEGGEMNSHMSWKLVTIWSGGEFFVTSDWNLSYLHTITRGQRFIRLHASGRRDWAWPITKGLVVLSPEKLIFYPDVYNSSPIVIGWPILRYRLERQWGETVSEMKCNTRFVSCGWWSVGGNSLGHT